MADEKPSESRESPNSRYFQRNFLVLAFAAITKRIGWIFKTESIIMPGFVYTLTDSGTLRGILPLISRAGRSLPQFIVAHWIGRLRRKWPAFFVASLVMTLAWAGLAGVIFFFSEANSRLILITFFLTYAVHWIANGNANLLEGVLQGKLIPYQRRGRLLAASNSVGCVLAIVAVYFLLQKWLDSGNSGYSMIFGMTAILFFISTISLLALKEPPDIVESESDSFGTFISNSAAIVLKDKNFRRLIYVISMFHAFHFLFPHYAVFGMQSLGLGEGSFIQFLIAQNAVNALGSLLMGYMADRNGNKIVLGILVAAGGCIPLLAMGIAAMPPPVGRKLYWIVFACIGVAPVLMRIIVNYVLEICPEEKHSQYLGTLNLMLILPTMGSPLVGYLIDRISFRPVFTACSIIVFCGALLSLKLDEPRRQIEVAKAAKK